MNGKGGRRRAVVGIAFLGLCLLLALSATLGAAAAPTGQPLPRDWGATNGTVTAVAVAPDGSTYIGGNFTAFGLLTGSFAAIDRSTGIPHTDRPIVNGEVRAVASDDDGGWFIGGDFSAVGGEPRERLAHIYADGTLDPDWNPGANDSVWALAVSHGTVYAGGWFTHIGGVDRTHIAAIDADSGEATDWNPVATSRVRALAVSADGDTLYVGGDFVKIANTDRGYAAAFDLAHGGTLTGWSPNASRSYGPNAYISTLAVSGDTVYAAGYFTRIGNQTRFRIAALDATTGVATGWNPDPDGEVRAVVPGSGAIYVGGDFNRIGGQYRFRIAALDATNGNATAWDPEPGGSVYSLAVSGGTVYAGGWFSFIGGEERNHIAAIDATTGNATAWNPGGPDSPVKALCVSGDTVYAGGSFSVFSAVPCSQLAHILADGTLDRNWNANVSSGAEIHALAVSGDTVYVGGYLETVGGKDRSGIAALDADSGDVDPDWDPNADDTVRALAVSADGATVYVGGDFTNIGGEDRNYIAAIDADSGEAIDWDPDADSTVNALAVSPDGATVYAGGWFDGISGSWHTNIAAIDADSGEVDPDWIPEPDNYVRSLAVSADGDTVYASGAFTEVGDQERDHIAAIDADSGEATEWDPGADGDVFAFAVSGDTVYAGGVFTEIGGESRNHIAAIDAASGVATDWDPDADDAVNALAIGGGAIRVGGSFIDIGGERLGGYASFWIDDTAPVTTAHGVPGGWTNEPVTLTFTADDGDGSGVARTEYRLGDEDDWTEVPEDGLAFTADGEYAVQYRSVDRAGNAEAAQTTEVRIDSVVPLTTVAGAPTGWTNKAVTLIFTADDGDGSGVARTEYRLGDEDDWTTVPEDGLEITDDGEYAVQYRSVDRAGNAEAAQTAQVRIDKVKPRTAAPKKAKAKRGAKARLRYRVTDAVPNSGKAVVVIKVKKAVKVKKGKKTRYKLVKTIKLGQRPVKSALQSTTFRVPKKWKRGTYRFYVSATDLAGNKQVKIKSNKLLVR